MADDLIEHVLDAVRPDWEIDLLDRNGQPQLASTWTTPTLTVWGLIDGQLRKVTKTTTITLADVLPTAVIRFAANELNGGAAPLVAGEFQAALHMFDSTGLRREFRWRVRILPIHP